MPTIISHAVVPLALGLGLGSRVISPRLLVVGMVAAMAPDADVLAFKLGIAYAAQFGHRGASHSILFAALMALWALSCAPWLRTTKATALVWTGLATLSHPLLDMMTNGGLGVALFWPLSGERLFFPWQVIEVSPIGVKRIFSERGLAVIVSELVWVGLPALVAALGCRFLRNKFSLRSCTTMFDA